MNHSSSLALSQLSDPLENTDRQKLIECLECRSAFEFKGTVLYKETSEWD